MNAKIETMIDEIHDMLIEYMHESDASPILNKVRKLAEDAHQDGYYLGSEESLDDLDYLGDLGEYDV